MKRLTSFFRLGFPFTILLVSGLMQGCCGIASGPSVPEVQRWMSVIHKGDSADKAVAVLRERGFRVDDNRQSPELVQLGRERGIDMTDPYYHYIYGVRVTDRCIFTLIEKHVAVLIQLDSKDFVSYVKVTEGAEGP